MKQKREIGIFLGMMFLLTMLGCSRAQTPDFQHLHLPKTLDYYLVCPQGYCNVIPNAPSPIYPVSAEDLFVAFNQLVAQHRDLTFTYTMPEEGQYMLVSQGPFLRLPDDIVVQFIAISDQESTLAILSQSRYLPYDFGVNKRRLEQWLKELKKMTKAMSSQEDIASTEQLEQMEETAQSEVSGSVD